MSYEKQQINEKWFRRRQWTIMEAAHIGAGAEPYQGSPHTDNPHEALPRIQSAVLREAVEELYTQLKDALGREDLAVSEKPRTGLIGNTRIEPRAFVVWAKAVGWNISHVESRLPSDNDNRTAADHESGGPLPWIAQARAIGEKLRASNRRLNLDRVAEKVREEMSRRHGDHEPGMTGRGGRVPSAATVKRHALTGL